IESSHALSLELSVVCDVVRCNMNCHHFLPHYHSRRATPQVWCTVPALPDICADRANLHTGAWLAIHFDPHVPRVRNGFSKIETLHLSHRIHEPKKLHIKHDSRDVHSRLQTQTHLDHITLGVKSRWRNLC